MWSVHLSASWRILPSATNNIRTLFDQNYYLLMPVDEHILNAVEAIRFESFAVRDKFPNICVRLLSWFLTSIF